MPSPIKKRWSAWVCCLLVAASPCAAANWVLRAGIPEGLPGYSFDAQGQLVNNSGPRQQLFACIESTLNARFVWQALPTKRLLQMIVAEQLDLAYPMGFTPERTSMMRPSAPTWDSPDVWLSTRPVNTNDKSLRLAARLGSPQQVEQAAAGYDKIVGSTTYTELPKVLAMDMADAVIIPKPVFDEQRALWPKDTVVTPGRPRSVGFYLPISDPKKLAAPLDQAIQRCREAAK